MRNFATTSAAMSSRRVSPLPSSSCLLSIAMHLLLLFLCLSLLHAAQPSLPPNIPTFTISDNVNFTLPPPLTPEQTTAAIAVLPYHTSTTANTVRSHLPRFYGPDYFPLDDESARNEWIRGSVYYIIPGVVMAVLTGVAWLVVSVYLCCRSREYSQPGYDNGRAVACTTLSLCFFTLLAVIFACVGLAYNHYTTNGLVGGDNQPSMIVSNSSITFVDSGSSSSGVTTAAADILNSLNIFFTAFPVLLSNLIHTVDTTVGQVSGNITDASSLVTRVQVLAGDAAATVQSVLNVSVAGYGCDGACAAALGPLVNVSDQLNAVLLPVVEVIQYDIGSINDQIVASQQSIVAGLNSAIQQLDDVNASIASHESDAQTVIADIRKYNHDREVATVILLILPFVCIVFIVLALLFRSSTWWKINFHWMFFTSVIMWLLFGVHLAITSAISDACIYADNAELNLTAHFDTETTAVLQACLLNTSLLTAVNISNSLNFAFSIELPDVTSIEQLLDVNELNNLTSSITTASLYNAIGFNATAINATELVALAALNRLTTPDYFTLANLSLCNPSHYPNSNATLVQSLQSTITTLQHSQSTLTTLLTAVQQNVTALVAGVDSVQGEANALFASFSNVAATIAPVVNGGQAVVSSAYCGVLGNDYYEAKNSFCSVVQRGVGMIAVSTFLIAMLLLPAIVLSCVRADQQADEEMAGKEGVVLSSPGSPSVNSPAYAQPNTPPILASPSATTAPIRATAPPLPARPAHHPTPAPPGGYPTATAAPLASLPTYSAASYQPQYGGVSYAPQYVEQNYRYSGETESS